MSNISIHMLAENNNDNDNNNKNQDNIDYATGIKYLEDTEESFYDKYKKFKRQARESEEKYSKATHEYIKCLTPYIIITFLILIVVIIVKYFRSYIPNFINNFIENTIPRMIGENEDAAKLIGFPLYAIILSIIAYDNPCSLIDRYYQACIVLAMVIYFIYFMVITFIADKYNAGNTEGNDTVLFSTLFVGFNPSKKIKSSTFLKILFSVTGGFFSFVALGMFIFHLIEFTPTLGTVLLSFLNIFIAIISLAIIYKIFSMDTIKGGLSAAKNGKLITAALLAKDIIFYLPCLFIKIFEKLKREYKITTKTTYILFGVEILLIALYYLLPIILNALLTHDGKQFVEKPIYLNNSTTHATYDELNNIKEAQDNYNYHYSISSWIYINPQPPNTNISYTKDTSLLNYGGKPNILYNGVNNTLTIKAKKNKDEDVVIYETNKFPYQRWNNIVINYNGGTLDIFINNELVASADNIVPYMTFDKLTTGSVNGIHGGVCNVMYYDHVLTRNKISNLYKMLYKLTPPII